MSEPLRVLLFEDSEADAEFVVRELRQGGFDPIWRRVDTPEEAEHALDGEEWALVVSDYVMPRFSALKALELVHRSGMDVPFIVVSGTIGEDVAVAAMREGAHDYFAKGHLTRFVAAVRRALGDAEERRKRRLAEDALQRKQVSLEAEMNQRRRSEGRLAVQYAAALALAESASLDEAITRILRSICELQQWEVGELWQMDREANVLRLVKAWPAGRFPAFEEVSRRITFARGVGLPGRVWACGKSTWIEDVAKDTNLPHAPVAAEAGLHTAFSFPIVLQGEVLGAIDFFSRDIREPDDDLLVMFTTVGNQIGQFIGRRRSEEELIQRAQTAALGADVAVALNEPVALQERLQRCATAIVKHVDAAFARIWTLEPGAQILELQASAGLYTHLDGPHSRVPVGKYKIGLIAEERRPHLTNDVLNDPRIGDRAWAAREGMVSFAGHPLIIRDRVVGVMALFARHSLSDFALAALGAIADNVALAVEGKRLEAERGQLELQFRQAQKMEAIGRLAGGVAHDFNNLLSVILGYGNLLLAAPDQLPQTRKALEEICKAGERAAGLTRQLLAFSRQQVLVPEVFDLRDAIAELSKMLGRLIGEDIALSVAVDDEPCRVRADRGQIDQVLMNLAVNARDAMPAGGRLLVETRREELGEATPRGQVLMERGSYIVLTVSDTGDGMDAETQSRIFEPFFTTKAQGKGTGLGLATVYGIVKQSGGYIWVSSERGAGSTFKVYLPRIDAGPETLARTEEWPLPQGSETILLVEDEESLRRLGRQILEQRGYKVLTASGSDEAQRVAAGYTGEIHLLLSDVIMPGTNGRELAEQLAPDRPRMKVLYMSGYTNDVVLQRGIVDEIHSFIQKPFTPSQLTRKVRDVIDGVKSRA